MNKLCLEDISDLIFNLADDKNISKNIETLDYNNYLNNYKNLKDDRILNQVYDTVISKNLASNTYDLKKFFKNCSLKLKKNGLLVLKEFCLSQISEAYINSFFYRLNKSHIRYYTFNELISASKYFFETLFFKKSLCDVHLKKTLLLEKELDKLPSNIINLIKPIDKYHEVKISIPYGHFIFGVI